MFTKPDLMPGDRIRLDAAETSRAIAHLGGDGADLIVTDLMDRARYRRPDHVGIKRSGAGLALGVPVASIISRSRP
jgi:hypothetical protein